MEVEFCHGGRVTFICNTSIQKTCQINRLFKTDRTLTCYSFSFYPSCRLDIIFVMLLPIAKKLFIVGFYLQKHPTGVKVLSVSVLTTLHQYISTH